jgi:hypothetical protein
MNSHSYLFILNLASNIPFENRGARADEFIQALTQIWTEDVVEFRGRYYNIPASKIGPKPIQKPRIPIYLGGFIYYYYLLLFYLLSLLLFVLCCICCYYLPAAGGSLEYLANGITTLKEQGKKQNRDFEIIALTFPEIIADSHRENSARRNSLSGSVDDVGDDHLRIK